MPDITAQLNLPFLLPSQAQKHVTHNEALRLLDALVQLRVQDFDLTTPPPTPLEGDAFALGTGATGGWAGQDERLAVWDGTAWIFIAPRAGWRAWGIGPGELRVWDGTAWALLKGETDNLDHLGINTTADQTNRLSVRADATLLSHDGDDHRVTVNKASASDTASVLFQSNWGGRAEIGLAGAEDLSVKVSSDGSTWLDALVVDGATGVLSGLAVQSAPLDAGAGRLMPVGAFGLGGDSQYLTGLSRLADYGLGSGFYRFVGSTVTDGPEPQAYFYELLVTQGNGGRRQMLCWRNSTTSSSCHTWIGHQQTDSAGAIVWSRVHTNRNLVGGVSQSGGLPTGHVIETGTNANGTYTRFADGTQICSNNNAAITTDPAAFVGTVTSVDGDKLRVGRWF